MGAGLAVFLADLSLLSRAVEDGAHPTLWPRHAPDTSCNIQAMLIDNYEKVLPQLHVPSAEPCPHAPDLYRYM